MVMNMRPTTMLNERAKIYFTVVLVAIEDMTTASASQARGIYETAAHDEPRHQVAAAN